MRQPFIKTLLLSGALALGGAAMAQKPAAPVDTGQTPNVRANVRAEGAAEHKKSANTLAPAGEPSTMTNHQPNLQPIPTGERSRAEVREDAKHVKPQFGQKGERPDVPTNPTDKTGTPK
ncbi:serine/threonine protein kinase [Variovorax sp. J22R133]|uniref:serine/threonine protein kinase n=1 Tax=Variovorax brevis TaxID=3053503 RepID=UPI002578C3AD|nr:serine/threonine protein kinase [Variovorax sp. J22R133]MDM0111728.1 serine/threonine protein kinase [Variovorax sp. J22R133]